ncbi:MAG: FAD-dependent monooxygenase [Gemmatimonadaceae bacterium]
MSEVMIVGGGIGGLCAAIALQRHGVDAHVYEGAAALHAAGTGILVPPNALSVLASLGLADRVVADGVQLRTTEQWTDDGRLLQRLDGDAVRARWGYPIVCMRRSALQAILADAARPGTVHLKHRLEHVALDVDVVVAHFEHGATVQGQLLIGADGIHSVARRFVVPDASLRYSGQSCWRGLAPIALDPSDADGVREIWGGRERFGFARTGPQEVYWFAPVTAPAGTTITPSAAKVELIGRYRRFPSPVAAILDATPAEAILQTDLYDLAPLAHWSSGRVVLLGDAAHAMTPNLGQGGAQAMEDALSLAVHVQAHGASPAALRAYEGARRAKALRLVALSKRVGQMAHWENRVARSLRDLALRAMPLAVQTWQMDSIFTPQL